MKLILSTLAVFGLAIAALHAADPVINDNGTISRDGVSLNNAADALLNQHVTAAEFQVALQAKLDAAAGAVEDAKAAQQRAEAKLKMLVDGAKIAMEKPTSAERLAAAGILLTQVQASQNDEERAKLEAQQAEIAAKLQALENK